MSRVLVRNGVLRRSYGVESKLRYVRFGRKKRLGSFSRCDYLR